METSKERVKHLEAMRDVDRQQGRKEVVDWIDTNAVHFLEPTKLCFGITKSKWQAKLKQWGIERSA